MHKLVESIFFLHINNSFSIHSCQSAMVRSKSLILIWWKINVSSAFHFIRLLHSASLLFHFSFHFILVLNNQFENLKRKQIRYLCFIISFCFIFVFLFFIYFFFLQFFSFFFAQIECVSIFPFRISSRFGNENEHVSYFTATNGCLFNFTGFYVFFFGFFFLFF